MATPPEVMTAAEAAEFLRTRPETLKRLARQGKVPGAKLGHEWRFLREDLVDLVGARSGSVAAVAATAGLARGAVADSSALPADLRDRIMGFVRPRNWDGEGARAITPAACRDAVSLVEAVHGAVPQGLRWPQAGVVRWGAILLTWEVGDQAVSVYLPRVRAGTYRYQWEGPGLLCGEEDGSRSEVIGAVAKLVHP